MHDKNVAGTYSITSSRGTESATHLLQPKPGEIVTWFVCRLCFYWNRIGSKMTKPSIHLLRSPFGRGYHKPYVQEEEALGRDFLILLLLQPNRDNCLVMKARSIQGIHWSIAFSIILLCLGSLQQVSKPWSRNMNVPSAIYNVSVKENLPRSNMIFQKVAYGQILICHSSRGQCWLLLRTI